MYESLPIQTYRPTSSAIGWCKEENKIHKFHVGLQPGIYVLYGTLGYFPDTCGKTTPAANKLGGLCNIVRDRCIQHMHVYTYINVYRVHP